MSALRFAKLQKMMPEIEEAQARFNEALDRSQDLGGEEGKRVLREACAEFNPVLERAVDACFKDPFTKKTNDSLKRLFGPTNDSELYFGTYDAAGFLRGVIQYGSFDPEFIRRGREQDEARAELKSEDVLFQTLAPLLPEIDEAQRRYFERLDSLDHVIDENIPGEMQAATDEYNRVLHRALEACIVDTADRNSRDTLEDVFKPKGKYALYFHQNDPARFLRGVVEFSTFNNELIEARFREQEAVPTPGM